MLGSGFRSSVREQRRRSNNTPSILPAKSERQMSDASVLLLFTEPVASHGRRKSAPFVAVPYSKELDAKFNKAVDEKEQDEKKQKSEAVSDTDEYTDTVKPRNRHLSRQQSLYNPHQKREADLIKSHIITHQYTNDPTVAWEMLKIGRPVKRVRQMKANTPVRPDAVRFVCMACMHQQYPEINRVPQGDVLLVAGDFTECGSPDELKLFNDYITRLNRMFTVVIAGNHECTLDESFMKANESSIGDKGLMVRQMLNDAFRCSDIKNAKMLLKNAIYLKDSSVQLFGFQIYGTPWIPRFDNLGFNVPRGQALLEKWRNIPIGVDVLLTHTPPLGHGDLLETGSHIGCVELLNTVVKKIRPKYHVFGHAHSGYGCTSDGYTKFINCSLVGENMKLCNAPIIFDLPIDPDIKMQWYNKYLANRRASSHI